MPGISFQVLVAVLVESRRANRQENKVTIPRIGYPLAGAFRDNNDIVWANAGGLEPFDFHSTTAAEYDVSLNGTDDPVQRRRYTRFDASPRDGQAFIGR